MDVYGGYALRLLHKFNISRQSDNVCSPCYRGSDEHTLRLYHHIQRSRAICGYSPSKLKPHLTSKSLGLGP